MLHEAQFVGMAVEVLRLWNGLSRLSVLQFANKQVALTETYLADSGQGVLVKTCTRETYAYAA